MWSSRCWPTTVWWTQANEPAQMLADGRAAFSTILNGELHGAMTRGSTIRPIWDRQLYELDVFGVPKGNPKRDMAMDFLRFATAPRQLAIVSNWVPYGPARRSALPFVGRNPERGTEMRPYLPTEATNFATAFAVDDSWWHDHGSEIEARWQRWLGP